MTNNMNRHKNKIYLIMVAVLFLVVLSGCGKGTSEEKEAKANEDLTAEGIKNVESLDEDFELISAKNLPKVNGRASVKYEVYDKKTLVRYKIIYSYGYYGYLYSIDISNKVNSDGTPILYEGEEGEK